MSRKVPESKTKRRLLWFVKEGYYLYVTVNAKAIAHVINCQTVMHFISKLQPLHTHKGTMVLNVNDSFSENINKPQYDVL